MTTDPKAYGLICENKVEGPLIWESYPMTRQEAVERMSEMANRPNIIRVAVFRMVLSGWGNETLIPPEEEGDEA